MTRSGGAPAATSAGGGRPASAAYIGSVVGSVVGSGPDAAVFGEGLFAQEKDKDEAKDEHGDAYVKNECLAKKGVSKTAAGDHCDEQ